MGNPAGPGNLRDLLVDQLRDHALVLVDLEGRIVGWHADSERVLGYAAEEVLGQPMERLFTTGDQSAGVPVQERAVARLDGISEDDRWQVRKDGVRIWASGVTVALRRDDEVVGFAKLLRDRTDIKTQIEAAEVRVDTLTRADRRKDLFLATLAHELRNPLAPLVNALQLIRMTRGPAAEDIEYPLGVIERQVANIRRLVDDLQDLARIGAGKVRIARAPVDLQLVLRDAFETCRPAAEERRQAYRYLPISVPLFVFGDADRLQQVFVNLLTNAIKFTPAEGRVTLVSTLEGTDAVVHVQDTGIGVPPDVLPRIFDLFTQEAPSLEGPGGLGLGLALVRQLVDLHGGSVQGRSDGRGHGSTFTVRLPLGSAPGAT